MNHLFNSTEALLFSCLDVIQWHESNNYQGDPKNRIFSKKEVLFTFLKNTHPLENNLHWR
jgi:hypothetical protein